MNKLLFNLPTTTIPIYIRKSLPEALSSSEITWTPSSTDFPVRRIYCVGRNYREHTLEMGGNPDQEAPFFFMKPADAAVVCPPKSSVSIPYPTQTSSLHYEGELIVAIGKDGLRISTENAMEHVYGYALGCDLTRRDLQSAAKAKGRPWDAAKGFDYSCPMSPIIPKEDFGDLQNEEQLVLRVNDDIRQQSAIGSMIYSIPEVISYLSQLFWLRKGDLIMTGTPAGVSNLEVGNGVSISCGSLIPCNFTVGSAE
jgi:fumarylpyruvate hydrolase